MLLPACTGKRLKFFLIVEGIMKSKILLLSISLLVSDLTFSQTIQWSQKQDLPGSYRNGSAAACNGKVYFMGGYCESTPERFENSNFEYDPETDSWSEKIVMPTGRSNFTLVTANNKIYAIGGDPFSGKHEMYDPMKDAWTNLAPLPTPRQHVYGTVLNGKIYVIGGLQQVNDSELPSQWSYNNISVKNEVYDIEGDKWIEKAPMPTPRHGTQSISANDKIYVIGGMGEEKNIWKSLFVVEMYDPQTDKWETKTSLPEPRDGFGMFAINKKIFIVGGFNGESVVNSVLVYDTEKDSWTKATDFPNEKNGSAGAALVGDTIYIIGGCDNKYRAYSFTFAGKVK